jgi:hypothetical protein
MLSLATWWWPFAEIGVLLGVSLLGACVEVAWRH